MSGDEFHHNPPKAKVNQDSLSYYVIKINEDGGEKVMESYDGTDRDFEEAQRKIVELYFDDLTSGVKRTWHYILRERRKFTTRETLIEL